MAAQSNPASGDSLELDRALLDQHGPGYIETIRAFAQSMRAEGRAAEADEALEQGDRMCAILLSDGDLLAALQASGGKPPAPLRAEAARRGL